MSTDAPKKLFFYELCRLCLENEGTCKIFESSDLVEDIFVCTGVKVTDGDNLPQKICVKCSQVVQSWKELRLLASKNDAHLRTLFGDSQNESGSESDIIQLNQSASTTCVTPIKPERASLENNNNFNNHSSSKQKLCLLLEEGEKCNKTDPVIRPTIYLRKDLYPPSSPRSSPVEKGSPIKKDAHKLLKIKVEQENRCSRITTDDGEEIKYVCGECDKSFDTYKKLYLHLRLHNKKFICPLDACGKKFATKGDMVKHNRTHTGEKPFRCTQCDKRFNQRVTLRQHVSTLHSADLDSSS